MGHDAADALRAKRSEAIGVELRAQKGGTRIGYGTGHGGSGPRDFFVAAFHPDPPAFLSGCDVCAQCFSWTSGMCVCVERERERVCLVKCQHPFLKEMHVLRAPRFWFLVE